MGSRSKLKFDTGFTVTDDPANDRIIIGGGGGGGGGFDPAAPPHVTGAFTIDDLRPKQVRETFYASGYGAVGDGKYVTLATTATSAAVVASSATFAAGDVGKHIFIPGAGAAGVELDTTISAYTDSTHVTLAVAASTTVAASAAVFGTDDHAAIQAAIDAADAYGPGSTVEFGPFIHLSLTALVLHKQTRLVGTAPEMWAAEHLPGGTTICAAAGIDALTVAGDDTYAVDWQPTMEGIVVRGGARGLVISQYASVYTEDCYFLNQSSKGIVLGTASLGSFSMLQIVRGAIGGFTAGVGMGFVATVGLDASAQVCVVIIRDTVIYGSANAVKIGDGGGLRAFATNFQSNSSGAVTLQFGAAFSLNLDSGCNVAAAGSGAKALAAGAGAAKATAAGTYWTDPIDLTGVTGKFTQIGGSYGTVTDPNSIFSDNTAAISEIEGDIAGLEGTYTADMAAKAPTSRQIIAGTGMSGGGDLTADRTLTNAQAFDATAPTTSAVGDAAAAGSAAAAAHRDHTHGREAFAAVSAAAAGDASANGTATTLARSDHKHGLPVAAPGSSAVGDAAAAGSSGSVSRADHTHGREAFAAPGNSAVADAAAAGTAITISRSDHKHGREAFGSPAAIGSANADGTATTLARSDHVHAGLGTLLTYNFYNPTPNFSTYNRNNSAFADVDTSNMAVTFIAPASGKVIIRLQATVGESSGGNQWWAVASSTFASGAAQGICLISISTDVRPSTRDILITGLTAGTSYTFTWQWAGTGGVNSSMYVGGSTTAGASAAEGPATMEVFAA